MTKQWVANCARVGQPGNRNPAGASASHAQPAIKRAQKNRLRGCAPIHLRVTKPDRRFCCGAGKVNSEQKGVNYWQKSLLAGILHIFEQAGSMKNLLVTALFFVSMEVFAQELGRGGLVISDDELSDIGGRDLLFILIVAVIVTVIYKFIKGGR